MLCTGQLNQTDIIVCNVKMCIMFKLKRRRKIKTNTISACKRIENIYINVLLETLVKNKMADSELRQNKKDKR